MRGQRSELLSFFTFEHLPSPLRETSESFSMLAHQVASTCSSHETIMCLRKLLEAKDCAVRATLVATRPHVGVIDDTKRCKRCNWPLAKSRELGCVEGDCSFRCGCPPNGHRPICPLARGAG